MDNITSTLLDVVPLLLLGSIGVVWALWIHWRAPYIPEENVPFLCFRYARYYDWILYPVWGASLLYNGLGLFDEHLPYSTWWASQRGELPLLVAILLIPAASMTIARVLLHPLFARYPNTTWTRMHFLLQGIWMNARILVVVVCLHLLAFHDYSQGYYLHVVAVIGGAIAGLCLATYYLKRSLGIYKQQLGEGELYEAVQRLASLADMKPSVMFHHHTQCPLGTIFSPDNIEIDLSDVLMTTVTRDEFDALLLDSLFLTKRENQHLASAGTMGIGFVGFWGSVVSVVASLLITPSAKRDRGTLSTVEAAVDGEALMRALIKVQRLKNTVGGWLPSERKLFPASVMFQRIQEGARRYGVDLEVVNAQLAGEETTTLDYYPIPEGDDVEALLRPSLRHFGTNAFMVLAFVLPLLPALGVAIYQSRTGHFLGADYWLIASNILAGTVVLYIFQNHLGTMLEVGDERVKLESEMRDIQTWDESACFVGLCPRAVAAGGVTYNRKEVWDEGYVTLRANTLSYHGDKATFSLERSRVENIYLTCRFPGMLLPFYAVQIDFWIPSEGADDTLVSYSIQNASRRRVSRRNSETEALFERLLTWHRQDAAFQPASAAPPYPEPRPIEATADIAPYQPVMAVVGMVIFMLTIGVGLSWLAGLPSEPLSASTMGIVITSLAFSVIFSAIYIFQEHYGVRKIRSLKAENSGPTATESRSAKAEEESL